MLSSGREGYQTTDDTTAKANTEQHNFTYSSRMLIFCGLCFFLFRASRSFFLLIHIIQDYIHQKNIITLPVGIRYTVGRLLDKRIKLKIKMKINKIKLR